MKPYEHTGFRVMSRRCDQCLFGKNKIVSDERKAEVLEQAEGAFFQCHKATGEIEGGCCKGYFDLTETGIPVMVKRMGLPIQWIDPETLEEVTPGKRMIDIFTDGR